jgi:hypothetical protein
VGVGVVGAPPPPPLGALPFTTSFLPIVTLLVQPNPPTCLPAYLLDNAVTW